MSQAFLSVMIGLATFAVAYAVLIGFPHYSSKSQQK
jgi:hypothetical protein